MTRSTWIHVRTTESGVAAIDRLRGSWSRSEYVRKAVAAFVKAGRRGPEEDEI